MPPTIPSRLSLLRFRSLRLLQLIAKHGSVRKAADIICVTQPAASAMLIEVEQVLGFPLFERSRTGMVATPELAPLLERIQVIENELGALSEDADALLRRARRVFRIGVLPRSMQNVMPEVLANIVTRHRGIEFSLTESTSDVLLQGLAENLFDCVVGRLSRDAANPGGDRQAFAWETLYDEGMCLVAGRRHFLAKHKQLTLSDTLGCEWVLPPKGSATRNLLIDEFLHAGLPPPQPRIESANFLSNLSLAEQGTLLTVSPVSAARKYAALQGICVLNLKLQMPLPPISLIWRTASPLVGGLAMLRDELLRCLASQG